MALASLDISLSLQLEQQESGGNINAAMSDFGGDLTRYFPDVEIITWDKVGELKKEIKEYKMPEIASAYKIRAEIQKFHAAHPEFLSNLDELRKK